MRQGGALGRYCCGTLLNELYQTTRSGGYNVARSLAQYKTDLLVAPNYWVVAQYKAVVDNRCLGNGRVGRLVVPFVWTFMLWL